MKVAVYTRVSTTTQAEEGYSLEAQYDKLINYITFHKMELFHVYTDPGVSAKDLNRPGVQQMIRDLKDGLFDVVLVHKLDRLTRNIGDLYDLVETVNKCNVKIISLSEDIDTSTPSGRMFVYFLGIFAQMFRENLAEEVRKGQLKKHTLGERVSLGLIYGYDTVNGKLAINEEEADTVRKIFGMYVYKGYGYGRICQELNEQGVKPKIADYWMPPTVKGMLSNVTYIGMNSWAPRNAETERKIVQGEHEAIVTEDVFDLAQTQLQRRSGLEMSRSSYNYPFSSIIKCGECGGKYTSHNSVKRRNDRKAYTNYRCANRKGGTCKSSDIAELKLTRLFFDFLRGLTVETDEYTPETVKAEITDTERVRKRIEKEINKIEARKTNLGMDLADRIISRDDYRTYMETINQQLEKLRNELYELQPVEKKQERTPEEIKVFIEELEDSWDDMNNEDRKFIIQQMFKAIEIKKDAGEWRVLDVEWS